MWYGLLLKQKRAYEEKLKEAEVKLTESALKTRDYKQFATELIEKYEHLKEKKTNH